MDQAGDDLNDGGQNAEHDSSGNVRASKQRNVGNEIQMWVLGMICQNYIRTVQH